MGRDPVTTLSTVLVGGDVATAALCVVTVEQAQACAEVAVIAAIEVSGAGQARALRSFIEGQRVKRSAQCLVRSKARAVSEFLKINLEDVRFRRVSLPPATQAEARTENHRTG